MTPQQLVNILFQIIVFLFAVSVHESAHAWTAWKLGDPTARMLGRVTLNPIKHIDPIGTILFPLIGLFRGYGIFGWAKPTPVNTRNFRHYVRDDILTSVAGPISNLLIAVCACALLLLISLVSGEGRTIVHNIVKFRSLTDTSSALMPIVLLLFQAMEINVLLMVFNLIPVPPLDGSHVLRHFLSDTLRKVYDNVGIFGLLILIAFGGSLLWSLMSPVLAVFEYVLLKI